LVALVVSDAVKSAEWYQQNLGFHTTRKMDFPQLDSLKIIFLRWGSFELELIQKKSSLAIAKIVAGYDQEKSPVQGFAKIAFRVENVDAMADSLRGKAVRISFGPFDDETFHLRSLIIQDRDGNYLQFSGPLQTEVPSE
jgi:catechol 2,3-dioxygenase-like lactoylglutathione lyase family enzyme